MPRIFTGRLVAVAIVVFFLYGMMASMLGTLMPGFHLTPSQNGLIALAQALGLMIASILAGPLIDNRGKRVGLMLGLVLVILSLLGLPQSRGWMAVMALMFLFGLGGGTIVTGSNTMVSDLGERKRGSLLNFVHLFFGLGGLMTPLIAANLLDGNAAHLCYLVTALAIFTLLFDLSTTMPAPAQERGFRWSEVRALEGKPVLFLLSLFVFLYVACEVGFWNWLPKELIAQGIGKTTALNILSLGFALGMIGGRLLASRILLRCKALPVSMICAALMIGTTWWTLVSTHAGMAWIAVFLAGVAMGPVFPSAMAMTGDAFPKMTGTCIGVVVTAGWLGTAVSSWAIGALAGNDDHRLPRALLLIPVFAAMMVVTGLILRSRAVHASVAEVAG